LQCPQLSELPKPPSGKTGWPWTEESSRFSAGRYEADRWPRISVITPSFNQGEFIEETIRSVLLQGYPDLEYLVIDGGSKDNSVEIIKKYSTWLTYWVSEPDSGQSDAINHGLKRASGDFCTWVNSDDMLCKNALIDHARQVGFDIDNVYVGTCLYIDHTGKILSSHRGRVHSLEDLVRIGRVWRAGGQIVQPEVIFPRELALTVGGLNRDNHFTMDYELWGKLFLTGAKFQYTEIPFGMFREHENQKTHDTMRQTRSLLDTAADLVKSASSLSEKTKTGLLVDLETYWNTYRKDCWRGSGRLAKVGLPPLIVNPLRKLKAVLQKSV
jgi:glycosyltransferase involved in cell wall biosynthesis